MAARIVAAEAARPVPRDFLQSSADSLVLYPFRFRDPGSKKCVKARYIAARFAEWKIIGLPEIRHPAGAAFKVSRRPAVDGHPHRRYARAPCH